MNSTPLRKIANLFECGRIVSSPGRHRLRRSGGAHRPDGTGGRCQARLDFPCGISRLAGHRQPHPGAKPDRDGDLHRLSPRRLAGTFAGRLCFILPAAFIVSVIAWAYVKFRETAAGGRVCSTASNPSSSRWWCRRCGIWDAPRSKRRCWPSSVLGAVVLSCFAVNPLLMLLISGVFMLVSRAATLRPKRAVAVSDALAGSRVRIPAAFDGGHDGAVQPLAHVPVLFQGWRRDVWQRLCAAGVFAHRPGRTPALADGRPAAGRRRRRPVHSGSVARHRHLHRIRPGRAPGGVGGHRGDFPAGLCAGGHQRAARAASPPFADCLRLFRRGERGLAGADGRCDLAVGLGWRWWIG